MNYLRLLTCATAVGVLCSYSAVAADSNQTQNNSQQNTQQTAPQNSQAPQSQVHKKLNRSHLASELLKDTDQARKAISSSSNDQALICVNQALNAASSLRSTAANNPNSGANNNTNNRLVPVYTEWESASVIGPVVAEQSQRSHQSGSNPPARNQTGNQSSNQPGAQNSHKSASQATPETVRNVTGSITTIGIDPQMAYTHLQAAKSALGQSNLKQADQALAAVQDSVLLESVKSDLPLLKARQNLALACQAIKRSDDTEASAALRSAGNGLDEYANAFAGSKAGQAEQLRQQIDSYAKNLASNSTRQTNSQNAQTKSQSAQTNSQNAQNKVQNWWNQVSGLMHQPSQNSKPSQG